MTIVFFSEMSIIKGNIVWKGKKWKDLHINITEKMGPKRFL